MTYFFDFNFCTIQFNKPYLQGGNQIVAQYKIFSAEPKKYFIIDLCYPKHKLAIECDGDYWHANPEIYNYPNKTQINSINQYLEKNKFLTSKGFKILRFYETDIKQNLQLCTNLIHEELLLRNYVS